MNGNGLKWQIIVIVISVLAISVLAIRRNWEILLPVPVLSVILDWILSVHS